MVTFNASGHAHHGLGDIFVEWGVRRIATQAVNWLAHAFPWLLAIAAAVLVVMLARRGWTMLQQLRARSRAASTSRAVVADGRSTGSEARSSAGHQVQVDGVQRDVGEIADVPGGFGSGPHLR